jgi:hypothetical protein
VADNSTARFWMPLPGSHHGNRGGLSYRPTSKTYRDDNLSIVDEGGSISPNRFTLFSRRGDEHGNRFSAFGNPFPLRDPTGVLELV